MTSRRAVAPVIATLLLVAIAVVGGSIIFVFSQGFFSSAQISGSPQIESVKILGYDATDGDKIIFHDGFVSTVANAYGNATSDGLNAEEYVAVYLKNDSVNKITFSEIRVAGDVYSYVDLEGVALPAYTSGLANLGEPEYTIVAIGDGVGEGETIDSSAPSMEPGQQVTLVFALEKDVKSGRDMQFKLATASGAVFVGTINSGQQSG
jgi:flagellin-like protein